MPPPPLVSLVAGMASVDDVVAMPGEDAMTMGTERPRATSRTPFAADLKCPQYKVRVTTPRFSDSKIGVPGVDAISDALLSDTVFTLLVVIDAGSVNEGAVPVLESPPLSPHGHGDTNESAGSKCVETSKFDRGEGREEGKLEWCVSYGFL